MKVGVNNVTFFSFVRPEKHGGSDFYFELDRSHLQDDNHSQAQSILNKLNEDVQ